MICEWNALVECETFLPFMVIINRDSYLRTDQNRKTGLLFADRGSNNYVLVIRQKYSHSSGRCDQLLTHQRIVLKLSTQIQLTYLYVISLGWVDVNI